MGVCRNELVITSSCLSEQVYLISDSVVKLFVEGGLEASIHSLGAEVSSFSSFSLSLSLSLWAYVLQIVVLHVYSLNFTVYYVKSTPLWKIIFLMSWLAGFSFLIMDLIQLCLGMVKECLMWLLSAIWFLQSVWRMVSLLVYGARKILNIKKQEHQHMNLLVQLNAQGYGLIS